MQPGALSVKGFLAPGEDLDEVIARDAAALGREKISYDTLADRLEKLILAGQSKPGRKISSGDFSVITIKYAGFQQCPWTEDLHHGTCRKGSGAAHASIDWRIRNDRTHREMQGPGLIIHLIRDHHFFEGPGSPWRVDPLDLAHLLMD